MILKAISPKMIYKRKHFFSLNLLFLFSFLGFFLKNYECIITSTGDLENTEQRYI